MWRSISQGAWSPGQPGRAWYLRGCSPLGPRGILVLDLANRISGLAKGNQHGLGEMDTFFVTFRDLVPRRAVSRTGMINESGFDGVCYDDKAVFWHSGSLHVMLPHVVLHSAAVTTQVRQTSRGPYRQSKGTGSRRQ